ncbi:MAG TPA: hypothetical protein VKA70_16780 [Blastocatellia bacterium]|nr:hypothetical protein [Blastocatellia bacterium]
MTLLQALQAGVQIQPGPRIKTFGGWCRRDLVTLKGYVIGTVQTRRGRNRTEVITAAGNLYVLGHDIEWLVRRHTAADWRLRPTGVEYGLNAASA